MHFHWKFSIRVVCAQSSRLQSSARVIYLQNNCKYNDFASDHDLSSTCLYSVELKARERGAFTDCVLFLEGIVYACDKYHWFTLPRLDLMIHEWWFCYFREVFTMYTRTYTHMYRRTSNIHIVYTHTHTYVTHATHICVTPTTRYVISLSSHRCMCTRYQYP